MDLRILEFIFLLTTFVFFVPIAARKGLNGWYFYGTAMIGWALLVSNLRVSLGEVPSRWFGWGWFLLVFMSVELIGWVVRKRLRRINIVEQYRDWTPPIKLTPIIEGLLYSIPQMYLAGLGTVVVSNASGLNRKRRREKTRSRGRKLRTSEALGLYHYAYQGEPPWIELFVDNIFKTEPGIAWRVPFWRDWRIGHTLYHELGHHIHAVQAPEFREKEDVADDWAEELANRQYRRLHPLASECWLITIQFMKAARWHSRWLRNRREELYPTSTPNPPEAPVVKRAGPS